MRSHEHLSFVALVFARFAPALHAERVVVVAGGGNEETGPAAHCRLHAPFGIDFDHTGNMFVVEMAGGERVLRVDGRGILTVVAGTGEKGDNGDGGPAAQARFNGMHSLAVGVNSQGALYILERTRHALRVVDRTGRIRTVAGTGRKGFDGDRGEALKASFNEPKHLCVDGNDDVIIADTDNHAIRKYLVKENRIVRVAGSGKSGASGVGGPASAVERNQAHGGQANNSGVQNNADSLN